uniref:Conotoxin VnMKLT1-022 n=1 Tax=Conus ventricosus TaxID=117992 RepID=O1613_CONVE|nr:RecName: Full=Conotoxin VnMKLT1-022; Flags: Precursor [Conus ventricosus]AAG60465.1 conotoxin scaffold VI/VII precursor [Conus ventricosus]
MKLMCMMIVAVLFLTAWTFVTADDSINGPENRRIWEKLLSKTRDEMKNPEASKLNKKECRQPGEFCFPVVAKCCGGTCLVICI